MPAGPGLVIVQIDGMSRPELDAVLSGGRMPVLQRLVDSGAITLDRWVALLPPCTPASQAGILHGDNREVPGFRWFEKATGRLLVANHADDAAEIERRLSTGDGLLAGTGVSVGNLLAGDAAASHLTMATILGGGHTEDRNAGGGFPLDPRSYLRITFEMIHELVQEVIQSRRQRRRDVRPRMRRGWRYALERVVTNVPLRILSTSIVISEIEHGRPLIYVDFTGYDEIAHHCGPGRPESHGAANKIDRSIGHILEAISIAPRPYHLVVLSDHGQSLGATFTQRFGHTLVAFVASLTGEGIRLQDATQPSEYSDSLERLRRQVLGPRRASAIDGLLARRPGGHHRASRILDSRGAPVSSPADAEVADVIVCASGNLGLVYFTASGERLAREAIDARYPGLIDGLAGHPGIGLVVVRSADGIVAIGPDGTNRLEDGRVEGIDPLAVFGPMAAEGLRRIAGFENSGDLIAIGAYDPSTDEVVAFEELVGSHGGLGGSQGDSFLAYPAAWQVTGSPLIGSPAVNTQLRRWIADMGIGHRN